MNSEVSRIIGKALDGGLLNRKEIIALLSVENLSPEAFAVQQAGRAFTAQLNDSKAEVHVHLGLDAGACPMDCKWCSFASCNKVFSDYIAHPIDKIVSDALECEASGANALYLVTTVLYGRERFLETVEELRKVLKPETPLVANIPDFGESYANELVSAGVDGLYHVIRLKEGVHTRCNIDARLRTIEVAQNAGLAVGNCIEPIGPEHTAEELADLILIARDTKVAFSGAMRRNTVAGSIYEQYGNIPYGRLATYAAAVALSTGTDIAGNCTHEPSMPCAQAGANIMWASRGTDPRDSLAETTRGLSVGQVREMFFETDWEVLDGPSRYYAK